MYNICIYIYIYIVGCPDGVTSLYRASLYRVQSAQL